MLGAPLDALLDTLASTPAWLVAVILAVAAALENIVPPIPADVVVVFGGFLAGRGLMPWQTALAAVWIGNVAGALIVYELGKHYGLRFFSGRWGSYLLRPHQLDALRRFYSRYGIATVFVSRFLPMFRAVVPVFAGVARLGFLRTAIPIGFASAIWYGVLVYGGAMAGENWEAVLRLVGSAGRWLWLLAVVLVSAVVVWWRRSRHHEEDAEATPE